MTEARESSEVDPSTRGWVFIGERKWKLPDGTFYEFAPGVRQTLIVPPWGALSLAELRQPSRERKPKALKL